MSCTLESVLVEECQVSDVLRVDHVQSASKAESSGDGFDAVLLNNVGIHLEFGKRFFFML